MEQEHIKCHFCGLPVDPNGLGTYRRVVGWIKVRAQGGSNSITLSSPPLAWAHHNCIEIVKLKGETAWDQESLF